MHDPVRSRPQHPSPRAALLGLTLLASVALFGCSRDQPGTTAGEKVDAVVAKTQDKVEDAKRSAREAARAASTAVADTAITASVKAQLAADPDLRLLDISVDTESGRIVLRGTVPHEAARERATQIASAVGGVTTVDNRLSVGP